MSESKLHRNVVVVNPEGLHLRPAELLIRKAREFDARVEIVAESNRADCTSIISIVALGAIQGTPLRLEAEGPDAQAVLEILAEMFASGFGELEGQ